MHDGSPARRRLRIEPTLSNCLPGDQRRVVTTKCVSSSEFAQIVSRDSVERHMGLRYSTYAPVVVNLLIRITHRPVPDRSSTSPERLST